MRRAFLKEGDQTGAAPLPDRPISAARNLATRRGLRRIERKITQYAGAGAWAHQLAGMAGAAPLGLAPKRRTATCSNPRSRPIRRGRW